MCSRTCRSPSDHALFLEAAALGREIRAVETFARPPRRGVSESGRRADRERSDRNPARHANGARARYFSCANRIRARVGRQRWTVWNFSVSGYRLLYRWLDARKGLARRSSRLITALRDLVGRIAELIDLFARADQLLERALRRDLESRRPLVCSEHASLPSSMNERKRPTFSASSRHKAISSPTNRARNDGVGVADPEEVRARLLKLLAEARAAQSASAVERAHDPHDPDRLPANGELASARRGRAAALRIRAGNAAPDRRGLAARSRISFPYCSSRTSGVSECRALQRQPRRRYCGSNCTCWVMPTSRIEVLSANNWTSSPRMRLVFNALAGTQ